MKYSTAVLLTASAATLSYAQNTVGDDSPELDYLQDVCLPLNSSGYPDYNAPCNALTLIEYECIFGPAAGQSLVNSLFGPDDSNSTYTSNSTSGADFSDDDMPPMQDNSTQRACVCQSQFFAQVNGCVACQTKHGDTSGDAVSPSYISSISAAYCAATYTPTVGLGDYLASIADPTSAAASAAASSSGTSTFSDPIGNKTAVSYYYTASVTGTGAYMIETGSSSSVHTSNGQIVATASTNNNAAKSSSGGSSGSSGSATSSPSAGAAAPTQAVAIVGMLGLAGVVALL